MKAFSRQLLPFITAISAIFPLTSYASEPSQLFMGICMNSLGNKESAEQNALKIGLSKDLSESSKALMQGDSNSVVFSDGKVAAVIAGSGLCTIFASSVDPEVDHQKLKAQLPPATTPFKVEHKLLQSDGSTETHVYQLTLPTRPFADWVFSKYRGQSKYNIAISFQLKKPI